jgi:hypothetical protein
MDLMMVFVRSPVQARHAAWPEYSMGRANPTMRLWRNHLASFGGSAAQKWGNSESGDASI